jgi:hypothetical protein
LKPAAARVAGLIKDLQLRTTKKGDRFACFSSKIMREREVRRLARTVSQAQQFIRAEAVVLVPVASKIRMTEQLRLSSTKSASLIRRYSRKQQKSPFNYRLRLSCLSL